MKRILTLDQIPPPSSAKSGWPWTEPVTPLPDLMPDGSPWPRISITTPSFNQAPYLEETIRSVLLQGYPNLEYWVMDGGSTDESPEIIKKYAPWLAGWVTEKDGGQADAINKGWARSTGDLLGWLNSDDVLLPGALHTCAAYFHAHSETGFIFGDLECVDSNSTYLYRQTYRETGYMELIRDCRWISQPGNLIRRLVLDQTGPLDPEFHFLMDYDLWMRASLVTRFGYIRTPLARFRIHPDAKTSSKIYLAAQEVESAYTKVFKRVDLPDDLIKAKNRALGSMAWYSAFAYYVSGNFKNAYKNLLISVANFPLNFFTKRYLDLLIRLVLKHMLQLLGRIFGRRSGYEG